MKHLTDVVSVHVANTALTVFLFCNLHIVSYFSNPISVLASVSDFHDFFQSKLCWCLLRLFLCFFILPSIQHAFVVVNYFDWRHYNCCYCIFFTKPAETNAYTKYRVYSFVCSSVRLFVCLHIWTHEALGVFWRHLLWKFYKYKPPKTDTFYSFIFDVCLTVHHW
jgi:hypothetical protein